MPFVETNQKESVFAPISGQFSYTDFDEKVKESRRVERDVSPSETWQAAFSLNNTIASALVDKSLRHEFDDWDSSYNPFDDLKGYEDYADIILTAKNKNHAIAMKQDIDRQKEAQEIMAASGGHGIAAGLVAGVFDPTILLPAGNIVKGAKGFNLLSQFGKSGLMAAGGIAAYEGVLQETQETRTIGQSAINIGAGALLGGVLGAAISKFSRSDLDKIFDRVNKDMIITENADDVMFDAAKKIRAEDLGASAVEKLTKDDLTLKGALGVEKMKFSPLLRLNQSPSTVVRDVANRLVENPLRLKMQAQGKTPGVAAETAMGLYQNNLAKGFVNISENFKAYRKSNVGNAKYDMKRFKEEVSFAMRRGDQHVLPEIQQTAKYLRKEVFDPIKKEAIRMGLLPEDVSPRFADSYLTRVWSKEKIIQNKDEFNNVIGEWARNKMATERDVEGFEDYIADVVEEVYDTLTGIDGHKVPTFITPVKQGPLKEKLLDIEDHLVEDFLENDIGVISDTYVRKMGADIELSRVFESADLKEEINQIKESYRDARKNISDPDEIKKLDNAERQDIKDIELMRDLLRGHHRSADFDSVWTRGGVALRDVNFMSKLGGVTISSMADVAGTIFKHGIGRSFGDLMKFSSINKASRIKLIDELKESGIITERILNDRLDTLADITDPYTRNSGITKYTGMLSNKFSTMTGINHWNDMMKTYAGMVTQNRVMKGVMSQISGDIKPKEMEYLKFLGLSDGDINTIANQFKKHGEVDDGFHLINADNWDKDAADALRNLRGAIRKEANSIVITKGVGDVPSFMNNELGKIIMQFKTFVFAAHNRLLLRGLQDKDAAVVSGLISSVGMGMLVSKIKAELYNAGLDVSGSDRPRMNTDEWETDKWIVEGLDRSGVFAALWEINNTYEKLGGYGVTQALGAEPASRYVSRNAAGALFGPTIGSVSDLTSGVRMTGDLIRDQEVKSSDIHALRRVMPFQNLIGIRAIFDIMEEGAKEASGAK